MVPVAHANDGGGSIRLPASACGLVGLKPTRQRVTMGPLIGDAMSGLSIDLAVSRTVRDTAGVLEAVEGPAPGDPYVAPRPGGPYTEEVGADPGRLRVGLVTRPFLDVEIDPVVTAAAVDAGELLTSLGHSVEESRLEGLDDLDILDTFLTRWMAGQAATLDELGTLIGRRLTAEDVEPLTWALAEEGWRRSAATYLAAVSQHQLVTRVIAGWHESGFDLMLTPTMGELPTPLGAFDDSGPEPITAIQRGVTTAAFTALFNATGQPAISLPLHWSDDGLPIGVQLAAPYGREDLLIRVACQLEEARPWADRAPPVFAGAESTV
jgi:amidase